MKKVYFALLILSVLATAYGKRKKDQGEKPMIFAKGIISTEDDEFGATFTPDGKTCYFTMKSPSTISSNVVVICVSHLKNGQWTGPEIASFSGKYKDFNPSISPDGLKLFFISNRPVDGKRKFDTDIWVVDKSGEGWGEPKNLGRPVNTDGWELACSAANNGTLYFSTTGTTGNIDIYCSKLVDGKYQKPDSLGQAINSAYTDNDPFIAPDQSYLLFSSQGRPDALGEPGASASYPRGDLYISYRKDGKWTVAKNLGPAINSTADESSPFVSRDGKTLYFTSERNFVSIPMKKRLDYSLLEQKLHGPGNGLGDIYEVTVSVFMDK
jgi:hypothetical protein